jgi:hypothetical protein
MSPFPKTEYVVFSGKAKWAKVFNADTTFGEPSWRMCLYLSPEDVTRFKSLKLKNKVNQDEDGEYVNVKRQVSQVKKGVTINYTPPVITDNKGNPFNGHDIPNGSDVTVTLEYYGWPGRAGVLPGYAIRLHSVQVDNIKPIVLNMRKETTNEAATIGLSP